MKNFVLSIISAYIFVDGVITKTNTILTGNAGIGTRNPLEKLHVHNGSFLLSSDLSSNLTMRTIKFSTLLYKNAWSGI